MQLTGTHVIKAPPEKVWARLMDIDALARLVPGITSLQQVEENHYKALLGVKIGPVNASFSGQLQLEDLNPPNSFRMKVQQNSKVGNASAVIALNLQPLEEDQTEVSFEGDIKLSGMLASMGQRLVGGVANTLSKQFFQNMENELLKG